ncbi:thermonuclease family protein [Agrobacterium tumefaciens]|uniref:thermonuclease family protein n=1 Tax=Agrobacterium tumefaciens TaxID=358 RepID=UPI00287C24F4|nr:thermonuclease family protein [Agrobacterium tumefaciens]MDS7597355.1 thermonuclease family protein [Agrobacterium tumefaciens]
MRRNGGKGFSLIRDGGLFLLAMILGILIAARLDQINSETYSGRFFAIDGDTLSRGGERFRLLGIDAPELRQSCERDGKVWSCGVEARRFMQSLIDGATVRCSGGSRDRYERLLVYCTSDGRDVSSAMVEAGYAVATGYFQFSDEQRKAQDERAGIWSGDFQRPADWRRDHRAAELDTPAAGMLTIIRHLLGWTNG